jgi:hypothetical protein
VKIDGKWYNIDCTWDDPYPDEAGRLLYYYFLVTDTDIATNHTWDNTGLPTANSTDLGIIYETYKSVSKFSTAAAALNHITSELNKVNTNQSFTFEITVLSAEQGTLTEDIKALCKQYNQNYGCGTSYKMKSAGFYGYEYYVKIYK